MTVRIVHKNSEQEDKRPTAGQLAKGEIAVNLHEAGAFLSIKDTAGNVQQVGGVKVSNNSPANPVKGTFWLDSDNNTLFIFDGTQWRGVTGGGGGGGGSINLAEGDAINITQAGSTYTINVVAGAGITLAGDNVAVELDTDATTVGLKMVGAGDAGKLSAKVATASTLGAIKVDDTTIKVDAAGEIRAVVPDPLTYKGNINPTTEDGGADAIPTGSVGDAYTCSWGGTNVEGNLDNSPDWLSAIKGSDTTATLGDLLIINSGDGSGANQWTLVKTGTVDSGASIDVGDGTTAAFPPASPQEGDVWYNLDDGRTYVYITDSSGDTVWVDISPQGNQTLWKKDTTDIEPQTNTDNLKIPNLAGGTSTAGTTIVMADTNGVVVSNAVGDGLEISSGQLQVRQDSSANGVNLQTVCDAGNTTTTGATFAPGTDKNLKTEIIAIGTGGGIITGIVEAQGDLAGTTTAFSVRPTTAASGPSAVIRHDGSATFAGDIQHTAATKSAGGIGFKATASGCVINYKNSDATSSSDSASGNHLIFYSAPDASSAKTAVARIDNSGAAKFASSRFNIFASGETFIDSPAQSASSKIFRINADVSGQVGEVAVIRADGSAEFSGDVTIGTYNPSDNDKTGVINSAGGYVGVQRTAAQDASTVFTAALGDTEKINFRASGSATFASAVTVSRNVSADTTAFLDLEDASTSERKLRVTRSGLYIGEDLGTGSGVITNANTVLMADGSAVFGGKITLSGTAPEGIQFGSTNSGGNITSQTLDDYEEGTWTPTVDYGTINSQFCFYTKVGRSVTITGLIESFSDRTTNSTLKVSGLPFAQKSGARAVGSLLFRFASFENIVGYMGSDGSLYFYATSTGDSVQLKHNDLTDANADFYFTISYIV